MKKYILPIFVLITMVLCLYNLVKTEQDIVYIDRTKLFNEFLMKKEMAAEFAKIERENSVVVDSLNNEIIGLSDKMKQQEGEIDKGDLLTYNKKRNYVIELSEKLEKELQEKSVEITQQIWDRLNTYIKEYGISHNYKLILGAAGNGNIMYGDDGVDVTLDLIQFVNKKFQDQ